MNNYKFYFKKNYEQNEIHLNIIKYSIGDLFLDTNDDISNFFKNKIVKKDIGYKLTQEIPLDFFNIFKNDVLLDDIYIDNQIEKNRNIRNSELSDNILNMNSPNYIEHENPIHEGRRRKFWNIINK